MMDWRCKIAKHRRYLVPLANIGLLALWMWLYRAVFPYLGVIFTRQEFRTNQILLVGVIILILWQVRVGQYRPRLDALPQFYAPALALVLISSVLYLLVERYLDINTFSTSLFGLATYGLLGLWMRPDYWRAGLPAALLLIGALPFGEHLQTFIGYPVRLLTAEIVRAGLIRVGVGEISGQALGVNTILVFESGITKVDLPCSGVKSLWTGGLFFLAATWIERRAINVRWLVVAIGFAFMLLVANLGRVAILVVVGELAGWRLLAEMIHVPLGVIGFVVACGAALIGLRWAGDVKPIDSRWIGSRAPKPDRPAWLMPILTVFILVMALMYTPRIEKVQAVSPPEWQFSENLSVDSWPMHPGEIAWLARAGISSAERWRFEWEKGISGSMLMVSSQTWRQHHRPEACLEVYGLSVQGSFTTLAAPDFPVRTLSLEAESANERLSAVYWLQSRSQITDEYATRIWADLAPERQRWVLVTILFDETVEPASDEALALYDAIRAAIQANLEGSESP